MTTLTAHQESTLKDSILDFLLDGNTRTATYNALNEYRKDGTEFDFKFTTTILTALIKEVHEDLLENDLEPGHYTNLLHTEAAPLTKTITFGNGLFSYEAPIEDDEILTDAQLAHIDIFGDNVTDEELAQLEINDDSDEALLTEYQAKLEEAIELEKTRTTLKQSPIQLRRRAIRQLRREFPEFIELLKSRDLI